MRICKKCGNEKPLDEFPFSHKEKGYRRHRCLACSREYHKAYYASGHKKFRQRSQEAYYAKRQAWLRTTEGIAWKKAQAARLGRKYRTEVLDHYGRACACCGEDIERFLTIDHVNSDGNERREEHGRGGAKFYRWLIRNEFPDDFQTLCFNCNIGRALNGGICPHKEGSSTIPKGSRPQAIGGRSAPPLNEGEDIVRSARQRAAVQNGRVESSDLG